MLLDDVQIAKRRASSDFHRAAATAAAAEVPGSVSVTTEAALAELEARELDLSVPPRKEKTTMFGTVDYGVARAAIHAVNANPAAFVFGGASLGSHVMPDASLPCAPVLAGLSSGSAANVGIARAASREYFAIFKALAHPLVHQMLSEEAKRRVRAMIVLGGPQIVASLCCSANSFLRKIHAAGPGALPDEDVVEGLVADLLQALAVAHDCWCAAYAAQAPARIGGAGRIPPRALAAAANAARNSMVASAALPRPPLQLPSISADGSHTGFSMGGVTALPSQFGFMDSGVDLAGQSSSFGTAGFPPLPSPAAFGSSMAMLRAASSERQSVLAHSTAAAASAAAYQHNATTAIKGKDLPMRRLMMSYQRRGMTGSGTSRLGGPAKYVSLAGAPLTTEVRVSAKVLKRGRGESDSSGEQGDATQVTAAGANQAVLATSFGGLDSLASAAMPSLSGMQLPSTVPVRPGSGTLPIAPPALDMRDLPGAPATGLSSTDTVPTAARQAPSAGWESVLSS